MKPESSHHSLPSFLEKSQRILKQIGNGPHAKLQPERPFMMTTKPSFKMSLHPSTTMHPLSCSI